MTNCSYSDCLCFPFSRGERHIPKNIPKKTPDTYLIEFAFEEEKAKEKIITSAMHQKIFNFDEVRVFIHFQFFII